MIRVVSWNIAKRSEPWRELAEMGRRGEADVALLQEAGGPPGDLVHLIPYEDDGFWNRDLYDRWCRVVPLTDRVRVEPFRAVPPISELGPGDIGVSGIGTVAAARVVPENRPPDESFIVVSMYARWMMPHPITGSPWSVGASDVPAHRIISDLSAFIGHVDPSKHRILAAGDLNMIYGVNAGSLSLVDRERMVWARMGALGLEFIGPQLPNGRPANSPQPDVPDDTKNVPTYHTTRQSPADANHQLDYAFASRGFHNDVSVRALNGVDEWGSSDHCRMLIEVDMG